MVRALLVYVNSYMDNLIPIGVSLLSAHLKKAGHAVRLFDTTFYKTSEKTGDDARVDSLQIKETDLEQYGIVGKDGMVDDFRKVINEYKPDFIGMSIVESTFSIALELLESIKDYDILKVVGGILATMSPEEVIKHFDVLCVGEGEEALVELADRIDKKQPYDDIKNLWIKKDNGVISNPIRKLDDLTSLLNQDWSIYEKERFYKPMGGKIWISGSIELTRGCYHKCAFCCNAKLQEIYKEHGSYQRERNVEVFIDEIKQKIKKYGINYVYLVAENFLSLKQFDKFIELYSDIKLPFWIETRPETVKKEKIEKIKEIGCEGISIGVEHGNEEFRKKVLNRFVKNDVIIKSFKIAKSAGIRVCANNIIGFPTETRELIFDTIKLNTKLKADNVICNIFCPYRGTKLWELSVEKRYIKKSSFAGDYRGINAGLDMQQLRKDEIKGLQRTFPVYVYFPKDRWNEIKRAETDSFVFKKLSKEYKEKYLT